MANNNDEVIAVVSPRSVGGLSVFNMDAPITQDNVDGFHSTQEDITAASRELRLLGFTVLQEGPSTISISGSRKLYEDVFSTKLRKQKKEVIEGTTMEFFDAPGEPSEQLLEAPEALSDLIEGVALAEPPTLFQTPSPLPPVVCPEPPFYRYLKVPSDVGLLLYANRIHRMGVTGHNIKIAMIDTGFYRHPFYNWHGYRAKTAILGPGAVDSTKDDSGHGTGEAANIFATAPDIELFPVKMASDTTGAMNAAVAAGPHIITNSWGYSIDKAPCSLSPYLKTLETAVADAVASGIVVVFSAGNGHYGFPGSHPDVISVGGVHVNYPFTGISNFAASNYASSFTSCLYSGRKVPDVCGLVGMNVNGTAPLIMLPVQPGSSLDLSNTGSTSDGWGIFSGTSAAAPQVAGIVALILEKSPHLTPAQVKNVLIKSATDVQTGSSAMGQPAGPGPDAATGAGLANAKWAYLISMGNLAVQFFRASPEIQAQMIAKREIPDVSEEFITDLFDTLRSR
jgi:subtilase family serine protease